MSVPHPEQAPPGALVSVVITAHDEAASIRATLQALAAQALPDWMSAEVVLVDDRSTDDTLAQARVAAHPSLVILKARPDPASALTTRQQALDLGFRHARGAVILTLDADSRLPPNWIATMAAPILRDQTDAVAGPIGFHPVGRAIGAWQSCDAACYFETCALMARLGHGGGVFFGNFAFRASLYRETGGFGSTGPALTEDLAFARALHRAGARIRYADGALRVDVRAAPGPGALVARTLRVTRGPVSALAVVLTLWPLTLAVLLAAALGGVAGAGVALGLRYALGLAYVVHAARRHADRACLWFAPLHEAAVLLLALAAVLRRLGGGGIQWGGRRYD